MHGTRFDVWPPTGLVSRPKEAKRDQRRTMGLVGGEARDRIMFPHKRRVSVGLRNLACCRLVCEPDIEQLALEPNQYGVFLESPGDCDYLLTFLGAGRA